jgi:hypothetical protein
MRFSLIQSVSAIALFNACHVFAQEGETSADIPSVTDVLTTAESTSTIDTIATTTIDDGQGSISPPPETTVTDIEVPSTTTDVAVSETTTDVAVSETTTDVAVSETTTNVVASETTTDVVASETTTAEASSIDASTSVTVTSSASNATATETDDKIVQVGLQEGPESTDPIPPDVTTPEEHLGEQAENKPETVITTEDAKEIAIMETVLFDHFVEFAPAPADVGVLTIPANVSECTLQKRALIGPEPGAAVRGRSLWGTWNNCRFVTDVQINLHFHYIKATYDGSRPLELESRINANVSFPHCCFCAEYSEISRSHFIGRLLEQGIRLSGVDIQLPRRAILAPPTNRLKRQLERGYQE